LYAISGLVSTPEKWADFSRAWAAELSRSPRILRFKMNEVLGTSRGQFKTFTPQQREDKLLGLVRVINQYVEWDCTSTLDHGAYRQLLEPVLPRRFRDPYLWAFHGVLTAMCTYSRIGQRHTIDFVLDEKKKHFAQAVRLFEQVRNLPPFSQTADCISSIKEGNDETDLPLQAADMMAGQVRLFFASVPPRSMGPRLTALKATDRFSYNHAFAAREMLVIADAIKSASA
jgi:hypothetical protein